VRVVQALVRNVAPVAPMAREQSTWGAPRRMSGPKRGTGAESPVGARTVLSWDGSAGAPAAGGIGGSTRAGRSLVDRAKPCSIATRAGWEADQPVKANQGAAGVDGQSIMAWERALTNNLDNRWHRLSSGSDFPPPGRRVDIPQGDGRTRPLGMPTVADRIAQMGVKRSLAAEVDTPFHPDASGYRPGQLALEAVSQARERGWRDAWVLDLDLQGFLDTIAHELMMRAVRKHPDGPWVLLDSERWLKAPVQLPDGPLGKRDKGTRPGGVVRPLLAHRFLHDTGDVWMPRHHPDLPFERYADEAGCHGRTAVQAPRVRQALEPRCAACRLALHPQQTQMVDGKEDARRGPDLPERFDVLGDTCCARRSTHRWGQGFVNGSPAVSAEATRDCRCERRRWHRHPRRDTALEDLSRRFNPVLRGSTTIAGLTSRPSSRRSRMWTGSWSDGRCGHTSACEGTSAERSTGGGALRVGSRTCLYPGVSGRPRLEAQSRMSREGHVRFREGVGVRVPRATRLVIVCRTRAAAQRALEAVTRVLQKLTLTLHPTKTGSVDVKRAGFACLGVHCHQGSARQCGKRIPRMWPGPNARPAIRSRLREQTDRRGLPGSIAAMVATLNPIMRGWRHYCRVGNSTRKLQALDRYVRLRLRQWGLARMKRAVSVIPTLGFDSVGSSPAICPG